MKKTSLLLLLIALLGLSVSCNNDRGDNMERQSEEAMEEVGHEADEAGDNIEDAGDELRD